MTDKGFIATLQYNAFQGGPQIFQHHGASYVRERPGETRYVREYKRWNSPKTFTVVVGYIGDGPNGGTDIAVNFVENKKIILGRHYKTCTGALNFLAKAVKALDSAELVCCPCPWEMSKKERAIWERLDLISEGERNFTTRILQRSRKTEATA